MARESRLFTGESLQTVVAVCFVLSLLSVAFNFYNFTRLMQLAKASTAAENYNTAALDTRSMDNTKKVAELEAKLAAVETRLADAEAKAAAEPVEPE